MKLYLIDDINAAKQCRQLLKLSAECSSLQWSKTIQNVPTDVKKSLEVIQNFTELRLGEFCTEKTQVSELNSMEEEYLFAMFKKSSVLRQILGSGVVLADMQADVILKELEGNDKLKKISDALKSGKNLVML